MSDDRALLEAAAKAADAPCKVCSDHDDDCDEIADKVHCWLYDPARGMCPYLRAAASMAAKETP